MERPPSTPNYIGPRSATLPVKVPKKLKRHVEMLAAAAGKKTSGFVCDHLDQWVFSQLPDVLREDMQVEEAKRVKRELARVSGRSQ